ncbi:hypothetical protein D8L93_08315, partial [Sodalis-like symbiont of Bactericera trigonica]
AKGCHKVAKEHGITDEMVKCGLELSAVMGPGVKGVADGQTCKTIADALEILNSALCLVLEMLTVKGPAGDYLRRGESCQTVAKAYEIVQEEALLALQLIAVLALEMIAVDNGPAGEKVAQGLPWHTIARECGLSDDEAVFALANRKKRRGATAGRRLCLVYGAGLGKPGSLTRMAVVLFPVRAYRLRNGYSPCL